MTSAPPQKRRRRASPNDRELLDKAFTLFVDLGFEGASVDGIAASVGVAKRTLYQRYGDKEALFRAVLAHAIEQWILPVEVLRADESDDLRATLLTIGRRLLQNVVSSTGLSLLQLTNSISPRMPELGAHNVEKGFRPTLDFVTALLARRIGPNPRWFRSPADAAIAFMNLVVTGPATFIAQGVILDKEFVDRYTDASVSLFLHGILPPPERVALSGDAPRASDETQRLKVLLADAMVQIDVLREQLDGRRAGGDNQATNNNGENA